MTEHEQPAGTPGGRRRRAIKQRQMPKVVIIVVFVLVAGLSYTAGVLNAGDWLQSGVRTLTGKEDIDLSTVQDTYHALADNFDGTLDTQKLIAGASRGLVEAAGDQYTVYMDKEEAADFNDSLTGSIGGGIGVELAERNNLPTIIRLLQNNPAEKAGLQINDIIVKVNDEDVTSDTVSKLVTKIRGEAGTTVKLTISRDGQQKDFSITRAEVNNPSVYGEVEDGIGVMTVTRFDENTGSLARQVARSFKQQNVRGVVLDLRGNGGGYVTAAQALAGVWLNNQLVTTERSGGSVTDELKSTGSPILNGIPTVVLVNGSSASASEIVAGALHDHKVATLIGTTTFGKGSVQKLINLPDSAMLKVTVARWYTPNGLNISEKGIQPDKNVTLTPEDANAGRDPQLEAALQSF
jgi:carboxyl-terminal processing protease